MKPKKSVEEMLGYFVPMYENDWDIKIDSNENNYGASPKVYEALKNCNIKDISFYPFYGELSQKIADFYGFELDNIKVTNGADEAIQGIIQTYLEKDETLLTLDVSFEMPVIYAQIQGGKIKRVPFKEKWSFPISEFVEAITSDVKIIYIASPNNPTGNLIEENDLKIILEKAQNKVVLIDETYANYSGTTYKKYVNEYDNVFITRSFSKDFALAGMRLGCVISNEENIKNLKKVISPFSVNALAMKAGIAALEDNEYFFNLRTEILSSRDKLKIFFEELGAKVYPSYANFLLIDFGKKVSQEEIQAAKNLGGLNNDWDLTKFLLDKEGINVTYKDLVDVFQEIYWNDGKGVINNEEPLFDREIFEELSKNYNISIFTGRLRAEAMFALEKFNAVDLFFPILTTDDIPEGMGKPNPYGLNLTKEMTIASSYTYFGDTSDDILAAKAAKYKAIGVLPPQDKSQELIESLKSKGAQATLNSVNDIKSILEQKNEAKC